MNIDFNFLKKSIGTTLKFKRTLITKDGNFIDIFYATLKEVFDDYIIVEQFYVKAEEDYSEEIISQKRKLQKGNFEIDSKETPIKG
jgi:hypothetical protein